MFTLLILSSLAWTASILFLIRHAWNAESGYEDESGFHSVKAPVSRWRHVRLHRDRRDHREVRQNAHR
jgi:hypothetical protein